MDFSCNFMLSYWKVNEIKFFLIMMYTHVSTKFASRSLKNLLRKIMSEIKEGGDEIVWNWHLWFFIIRFKAFSLSLLALSFAYPLISFSLWLTYSITSSSKHTTICNTTRVGFFRVCNFLTKPVLQLTIYIPWFSLTLLF